MKHNFLFAAIDARTKISGDAVTSVVRIFSAKVMYYPSEYVSPSVVKSLDEFQYVSPYVQSNIPVQYRVLNKDTGQLSDLRSDDPAELSFRCFNKDTHFFFRYSRWFSMAKQCFERGIGDSTRPHRFIWHWVSCYCCWKRPSNGGGIGGYHNLWNQHSEGGRNCGHRNVFK